MGAIADLSPMQEAILLHLHQLHVGRDDGGVWGVPWRTTGTRSGQASLSRSLARLEGKGLLLRQNGHSGNNATLHKDPAGNTSYGKVRIPGDARMPRSRTTSVTLTDLGLEIATRLTTESTGDVNQRQAAA